MLDAPVTRRSGQVLRIVSTVRGYPLQVCEEHHGHRRHLEAVFTVSPTWPLFTLVRDRGEDRPLSSGEITAGWLRLADVAGCQLWTPDSVRTEQLFSRGLAEVVARHPLERLRIGAPAASFRSCDGSRLNADTVRWTLDLIEAILIGAPPYAELGLVDMAPGIAWTREHLDRDLGITPPDAAG
jgi:hypothetical protein